MSGKFEVRHKLDNGKTLKIETDYQKGGISFYGGMEQPRGIYIHFTEVTIDENGYYSFDLRAAYKVLFKQLSRGSKKQMELAGEFVETNKEKLIELYLAGSKQQVRRFIQER